MTRIFNFAAGPSAMPLPVLEQAASEMTDWHGVGYSILEMSHRSKEFMGIYRETVEMLRELYGIPEEYEVMFVQGGGHLQFAMIPLNFAVGGIGNYAVDEFGAAKRSTKLKRSVKRPKLPAPNSERLARRSWLSQTALPTSTIVPMKQSTVFATGTARKSMFS